MVAPSSFWQVRPGGAEEVGLVVVGGGIVGLSTAYWLQKAGKRAVLLEAERPAYGASGRNAGYLLTGTAEPYMRLVGQMGAERVQAFWLASRENRELLRREVIDSGRVDCEFLAEGSYMACLDEPAAVQELEESFQPLLDLGFEAEWRSAREAREASGCPLLGGAIFQPRDGGLDPVLLCRGLAALSGVELRSGWRVRSVEAAGERVRLCGEGFELVAERAVLALNAFAPLVLPFLEGRVRPVRGQMQATVPTARRLQGVWYIDDGYEYARQLGDGTFLLGGCRRSALEAEVGYEAAPTAAVQEALDDFRQRAFPAFAETPVAARWAGTMAFTDSGLPLVGEVPGMPAATYAAGFNGHGMSLGFVMGRYLAARLLDEEPKPLF
jgi:gamma-glutamylputrescine oxidase